MTETHNVNCIQKTVSHSIDAFAPADFKPLSVEMLKLIAYVTMVIDHIGHIFLYPLAVAPPANELIIQLYRLSRCIGRATIVIFGFLLVEGFFHTRSRIRYATRLLALGLFAEPFYDLMAAGNLFSLSAQNTVLTLLLSFLMLWAMDQAAKKSLYFTAPIIGFTLLIGYILKLDYGVKLPTYIAVLYLFRNNFLIKYVLGILVFWIGYKGDLLYCVPSAITLLMIALFYNGKNGIGMKYFGYVFYPLHMFILWAAKMFLI